VTLLGVPPASPMMQPQAVSGRWLREEDGRALVISRALQRQLPELVQGGEVRIDLDGAIADWRIVGVVDAGPAPFAYANRATLSADDGLATSVVFAARRPGRSALLEAVQALRANLADDGMPVAESQTTAESRAVVEDHLLMVVQFLGVMGTVMVVVGAVGLASTMSLAVLERTREIGVLRALGASDLGVLGIVQVEGLTIVALAWLASIPLSVPMSVLLANAFGRVMFPLPTPWWPQMATSLQWLAVMLPTAIVACLWPAWRAIRVTAADALSYE
jgi:putative ABC transport system permease protein